LHVLGNDDLVSRTTLNRKSVARKLVVAPLDVGVDGTIYLMRAICYDRYLAVLRYQPTYHILIYQIGDSFEFKL
jgi:hypothetical protein